MRQARMKVPPDREVGYYHCISRVVERMKKFGSEEKEKMVQIMREYEEFCEVRVLTYCIMANHFHFLVEVRKRPEALPSEEELLRKLDRLTCLVDYGWVRQRLETLEGPKNERARKEFLETFYCRMWDVSWFIRLVKQRFSAWYNRRMGRKGTLWEERFKSVLVEGAGDALVTMAAYIDLNPVRAGIVKDPKDYRWSGYGSAMAGAKRSKQGIQALACILEGRCDVGPKQAMETYRSYVHLEGDERREGLDSEGKFKRGALKTEQVEEVLKSKGVLPAREYVRCRVRYFCDGAILGSRGFVEEMFGEMRERFGPKRKTGARRMKGVKEKLFALRNLRVSVFGEPQSGPPGGSR